MFLAFLLGPEVVLVTRDTSLSSYLQINEIYFRKFRTWEILNLLTNEDISPYTKNVKKKKIKNIKPPHFFLVLQFWEYCL